MIEFKSDEEKIEFLKPIISKYRIFISKYIGISCKNVIGILSRRLKIPEEDCHLTSISSLEHCVLMLEELKKLKWELTGVRRLPKCGNIRNTLLIIKTVENLIFGGFTRETWGNTHIDKKDDYACCFSVKNNKIYEAVKGSYSIFFYPGNIFGFFWFIDIKENSLTNGGSDHTPWSNGYYEGITSRFELNEGKEDFKISEIECYQICN